LALEAEPDPEAEGLSLPEDALVSLFESLPHAARAKLRMAVPAITFAHVAEPDRFTS
jgi:hypothetical protein